MSKKHAVITGAGSGLGSSMAMKLSNQGFHISLLGRTKAKLEKVAATLSSSYDIYEVDISSYIQVVETFNAIHKKQGEVNLLINNAGVGVFELAEHLEKNAIDDMIDINLKGTIYCTQAVLPRMKEKNEGTIVNVISTAGMEGKVNESVYCASKFGVKGFTESLQVELQDIAVDVMAAYMGGMKTPFWDGILNRSQMEHMMEADDIAEIIMSNLKPHKNLSVPYVVIQNNN